MQILIIAGICCLLLTAGGQCFFGKLMYKKEISKKERISNFFGLYPLGQSYLFIFQSMLL